MKSIDDNRSGSGAEWVERNNKFISLSEKI